MTTPTPTPRDRTRTPEARAETIRRQTVRRTKYAPRPLFPVPLD